MVPRLASGLQWFHACRLDRKRHDHAMHAAIAAFLLGFPALFSIVNPVSGAFIFRIRTASGRMASGWCWRGKYPSMPGW